MNNYTPQQQEDINKRVEEANAFIKSLDLSLATMSYKVPFKLDEDGTPLFAEKVKVVFQDTKYDNTTTNKEDIKTEDTDGEEVSEK